MGSGWDEWVCFFFCLCCLVCGNSTGTVGTEYWELSPLALVRFSLWGISQWASWFTVFAMRSYSPGTWRQQEETPGVWNIGLNPGVHGSWWQSASPGVPQRLGPLVQLLRWAPMCAWDTLDTQFKTKQTQIWNLRFFLLWLIILLGCSEIGSIGILIL